MSDPAKMSLADFAKKIKSQHPEYNHLDDQELANRVLMKFPQYRQHVDMVSQEPKQASFGDRLTAGGSSEGAQKFDQAHPILGKPLRALDAAGGAVMGIPSFLYHSVADPLSPEEQARGQGRLEAIPERLLGAEQTAAALHDYGAGKVSPSAALSVLPEALGTGTGVVGATEGLGLVKKGLGAVTEPIRNKMYSDMPPSGKGPQLTPFAKKTSQIVGGAAGTALAPSPLRYEGAVGGYLAGPEALKAIVGKPELGSIKNPGLYSKMPLRSRVPESGVETPASQSLSPLGSSPPRGRMGPPLRPNVFASPEDAQIYDAQMSRLGAEAKDAGMYSAARGAVKRIPDYQERIGNKLRPFGPPEDLMEESTPPVRRKVENE